MFNLFRRISGSVIPRPDRPWADDPTSNAPQVGRKRRLSSTERDIQEEDEESKKKKVRGETGATVAEETEGVEAVSAPPADGETKDVQEVTQGVKEVELEDAKTAEVEAKPETVPLPAEETGELEEPTQSTVVGSTQDKEETAPSVDKVEEETQHASKEVALDDAAQGKEAGNDQAKDATSTSQSTGNSSNGPTNIETNDS